MGAQVDLLDTECPDCFSTRMIEVAFHKVLQLCPHLRPGLAWAIVSSLFWFAALGGCTQCFLSTAAAEALIFRVAV